MSTEEALRVLDAGGLVVLPTDTVYGVGARPSLPDAVKKIFEAKGRPADNPLPVLGASIGALEACVIFDERAMRLGSAFWPGPLTIVLPRAAGFDADLGGEGTRSGVAVRVPAHDLTLELLRGSGPLAVTSANRSGEPPAATIAAARDALGAHVEVFLDAGPIKGQPSTIVSLLDDSVRVLRQGSVSEQELAEVLS